LVLRPRATKAGDLDFTARSGGRPRTTIDAISEGRGGARITIANPGRTPPSDERVAQPARWPLRVLQPDSPRQGRRVWVSVRKWHQQQLGGGCRGYVERSRRPAVSSCSQRSALGGPLITFAGLGRPTSTPGQRGGSGIGRPLPASLGASSAPGDRRRRFVRNAGRPSVKGSAPGVDG